MENRKTKKLIFLVAFTAIMLISTTYAWFVMNNQVKIGNLEGSLDVVEGLEVSLDAKSWSKTIDFSKYTDQTALRKIYTQEKDHNIIPEEMIPVSTTGKEGIDKTDITMYRGTNSEGIKLETVEATSTEITDVTDNKYPGYYAIDLFIKNSSKIRELDTNNPNDKYTDEDLYDVLQLNEDSLVKIKAGGKDTAGLQNTVRVGLALYNATENGTTASTKMTATQSQILAATTGSSATIKDVAIWEPNSSSHENQIVANNNKITWKDEDKAGYIADQTTGKFTATEKVPTYALKSTATAITGDTKINDIYDWSGTNNSYLEKQITLQTTKSQNTYNIAEGVQNLISVKSTETAIYPNSPNGEVTTFKIPKNKISRLRMYIWLEGQDVDCTNLASHGGGIKVDLGLIKDAEVGNGSGKPLENLSFDDTEYYVALGKTLDLQVKTNEGVLNPNLTWKVEDETVLSIQVEPTDVTTAKITPKKEGETVITVTSADDENIAESVTVYALSDSVSFASLLNFEALKNETSGGTYLPTGFSQVAGTSLDTGLTIQDSAGNQYVWIEVPQTTGESGVYKTAGLGITEFTEAEYKKIENDLHTYTSVYRNNTSNKDEYYNENYSDAQTGLTKTQYNELKQKMLKSVYQNGGFYVGKYETGIEDAPKTSGSSSTAPTEEAVIKQNAYPYNYVTCSQAQKLASEMESGEYTSSLMFGVQWDLVLKYLETKAVEKGAERTAIQAELNSDSANWGNYANNNWTISNASSKYAVNGSNWKSGLYNGTGSKGNTSESMLLSTGASDAFSKQGIYDLAGNVREWTLEYASNTYPPCAARGGDFYGDTNDNIIPASSRGAFYYTAYYVDYIGFRVALY